LGGANLNFEHGLRGEIIILKIKKKYHENQREKLILMIFFSKESLIHAPTLLRYFEESNWSVLKMTGEVGFITGYIHVSLLICYMCMCAYLVVTDYYL
jgi:hypothetical protein